MRIHQNKGYLGLQSCEKAFTHLYISIRQKLRLIFTYIILCGLLRLKQTVKRNASYFFYIMKKVSFRIVDYRTVFMFYSVSPGDGILCGIIVFGIIDLLINYLLKPRILSGINA